MYADADGLVLSPTDLTEHLGCPHATTQDLASPAVSSSPRAVRAGRSG